MKSAQDCKPGQIVKMDGKLFVVMEWKPYKKGDRGPIIVDMKFRNLDTGAVVLKSPRSQDMFEDVWLDRKIATYSYHDGDLYIFMDKETFDQIPLAKEVIGENLPFLKENMEVSIYFHDEKAVSVEFPIFVEMEITYTENVIRGDSSGKIMKKATLEGGYEFEVPGYCNIGDKIRIDTRTHEYVERVSK
jgi:elongation factor P